MNRLRLLSRSIVSRAVQIVATPGRSLEPADWVVAVILVGTLIRFALAGTITLGHGEAYYFSCARHLEWSYFDHPPMHAWLARLAFELGGAQLTVLRAPFILFFAGTNWLLFVLGRKLFSAEAGLYAVVVMNLSPVFTLTTGIFLQPDSPLLFFWLLTCYQLVRLLTEEHPKRPTLRWAGVGASAGIALLCKYHAFFLLLSTFVFVITRKDQRHWLRQPGPYLAVLVMAAASTPVLIWNSENEWISFFWQAGRGTEFEGFHVEWLLRSVMGQALWLMPWIWVPLIRELYLCYRAGPSDPVRWLIACLASPPILFFTITAIYAPYGYHFHWQAPGYLMLFLPLGATVANAFHSSERQARLVGLWLKLAGVFLVCAFLLLSTHTRTGWAIELLPEPYATKFAQNDPTLEGLEFTPLEGALAEQGLLDRDDLFFFTYKWFLSGKVDYVLRGRAHVLCLSPDDQRSYAFMDVQEEWLGKDGYLIADDRFSPRVLEIYAPHFESITLVTTVDVPRGKRIGSQLRVYRCEKFKATLPQPYGKSREAKTLAVGKIESR